MKNGLVRSFCCNQWFKNDLLHREDGPAQQYHNSKYWYINGKLHRLDGPAVERAPDWYGGGGYVSQNEWHINGELHRENDPAVEYPNGDKFWYCRNLIHRLGYPAVMFANGTKAYFVHGKRHREDGPAVEWADGTKEWWIDGKLSRVNGPAIEFANGAEAWFLNGLRHRLNGPAVRCANGQNFYFLYGLQVSEDVIKNKSVKNRKGRWQSGDILHRADGPAIETSRQKEWYIDGKRHRVDGPAVEYANGRKEYWIFNTKVPAYVVKKPNEITVEKISNTKDQDVRFLMIEKFGWHNYFLSMNIRRKNSTYLKKEDKILNLFVVPCYGNILVVEDCDKMRVHAFKLPEAVNDCKKAYAYLKDSRKQDWEQELMASPFIVPFRTNFNLFQFVGQPVRVYSFAV